MKNRQDQTSPAVHLYALGVGANRSGRFGSPVRTILAATASVGRYGRVVRRSALISTPPLGPGGRRYVNAAILLETILAPGILLAELKAIERAAGRRPGRRWGARPLDLDILLWSGGRHATRTLTIPHRELARRRFALDPLAAIAPAWRVPGTGVRVRHLAARLTRPRPAR